MAISRTITHHTKPVEIQLPRIYVVAWLANANGEPITDANRDQATFIRTELFDDRDEAWSKAMELQEVEAVFYSAHDQEGESII